MQTVAKSFFFAGSGGPCSFLEHCTVTLTDIMQSKIGRSQSVSNFGGLQQGGGGLRSAIFRNFAIFRNLLHFPAIFLLCPCYVLQVTLAINAEPYWCTQFCRTMRLFFAHA